MTTNSEIIVILGSQWGDEGKGKIVDLIASKSTIVCRCQGGSNAGHTVVANGEKYDFHLLPSGILQPNCINIIGNGVVVHLPSLISEIRKLNFSDLDKRLLLSDRAHIVLDFHQSLDAHNEVLRGNKSIGTTKKGIGPCYASKAKRTGLRMSELINNFPKFSEKLKDFLEFNKKLYPQIDFCLEEELKKYKEYAEILKPHVTDTVTFLHEEITNGKNKILVEGANATLLDIDFGTYPYVTSSNCSIGGVITGLGVPPRYITSIIGVVKSYSTRVGGGPFPTELCNEVGDRLRDRGSEYGVTTGRPRRCGWLDLFLLKYTHMINHYDALAITKLDILDELAEIQVATAYLYNGNELKSMPAETDILDKVEVVYKHFDGWQKSTVSCKNFVDLPQNAQIYVKFIESYLKTPVKWIGVGQDRCSIITL